MELTEHIKASFISQACLQCQAPGGESCKTSTGKPTKVHEPRKRAGLDAFYRHLNSEVRRFQ